MALFTFWTTGAWLALLLKDQEPFLYKVPVTFQAHYKIFKSKQVLFITNSPVHFVFLTDNFIIIINRKNY